jgi:hypothetical protein
LDSDHTVGAVVISPNEKYNPNPDQASWEKFLTGFVESITGPAQDNVRAFTFHNCRYPTYKG